MEHGDTTLERNGLRHVRVGYFGQDDFLRRQISGDRSSISLLNVIS